MPVYVEISQLYRLVTIVARGALDPGEADSLLDPLTDPTLRRYSKIVEMIGAEIDLTEDHLDRIDEAMRERADTPDGAMAFVINPDRADLAMAFAKLSLRARPVALFRGLRDARAWLDSMKRTPAPDSAEIELSALLQRQSPPPPQPQEPSGAPRADTPTHVAA